MSARRTPTTLISVRKLSIGTCKNERLRRQVRRREAMGFTTGFLGGVTLTTTLLYLSLNLHTRNRISQAALLHQQGLLLSNIVEPQPPLPPPTAREVRAGLRETAKDRWNAELENGVRRLQRTDWGEVWTQMEEGASRVWRRTFRGAEQGMQQVEKAVEQQASK